MADSEPRFVGLMNRRARELELQPTRFANASGHNQAGRRASVRDLARLAEAKGHRADATCPWIVGPDTFRGRSPATR